MVTMHVKCLEYSSSLTSINVDLKHTYIVILLGIVLANQTTLPPRDYYD